MATTKVINIDVNDADLELLNDKLKKTKKNFDDVDGSANKTSTGFKKIGENGGAIAILDEFTGGLATKMRDAAEASKLFSFSLKGIQSALIATGIGALVVALGVIVAYWDEILDYVKQVNQRLEQQIEYSRRVQENLSFELELLKLKEEIQITEGKNTDEIIAKKKEIIQLLQIENANEISKLETQKERLLASIQEVTLLERIISVAKGQGGFVGVSESENEQLKTITEGIQEAQKQALELELQLAKINNPTGEKANTQTSKLESRSKESKVNPLTGEDVDAENERLSRIFRERFGLDAANKKAMQDAADFANMQFLNSEEVAQARRTQIEAEYADLRTRIAEEEFNAKMKLYDGLANGLGALGDIVGRETAAGKAFAVAGALINTYASIAGQLKAFAGVPIPGFAIAQAAATALTGFAAVKNILSVKVPGSSGGGSSGGGAPSRPPSFNVVESNPQNQLNQALLEKNTEPVQAFVVDKNVTTAQELRRNKIESSSI